MKKLTQITRREFLALAGITAASLYIPGCKPNGDDPIIIPKKYILSGKIISALDLNPIQGAKVRIGTEEATTDINGDWILTDFNNGNYNVEIADGQTPEESLFATYKAGILPVNDINETWLSNLYWGLKPMDHNDFVYDTILENTGLRTEDPNEIFHTIIYTKDLNGGADMPASVVDAIKSYTINERAQFSCKTYIDPDDFDINTVDIPSLPGPPQTTIVYWNTAFTGAGAAIELDGDKIISSSICLSSDIGGATSIEALILSEILRILTDGGDDSPNNTPHAYMVNPQTTVLNQPDILNSNLTYGLCKKPWGNKDERTPGNYDKNPTGHILQQP